MTRALFALAATTAFIASPASAETFVYTQDNGNVLTIDTTTQTGSIIGPDRNITFTSSDFANFEGGNNASGSFNISIDPSSTVSSGTEFNTGRPIANDGTVYSPVRRHAETLRFEGNGRYSVWAVWEGNNGISLGDEFFSFDSFSQPQIGSSTSSGGSGSSSGGSTTTSGGSSGGGSSSGGADVPAPGVLGLMALALAAIGLGRRRRKVQA